MFPSCFLIVWSESRHVLVGWKIEEDYYDGMFWGRFLKAYVSYFRLFSLAQSSFSWIVGFIWQVSFWTPVQTRPNKQILNKMFLVKSESWCSRTPKQNKNQESINFLNPLYPFQGHGVAGAYPGYCWGNYVVTFLRGMHHIGFFPPFFGQRTFHISCCTILVQYQMKQLEFCNILGVFSTLLTQLFWTEKALTFLKVYNELLYLACMHFLPFVGLWGIDCIANVKAFLFISVSKDLRHFHKMRFMLMTFFLRAASLFSKRLILQYWMLRPFSIFKKFHSLFIPFSRLIGTMNFFSESERS